MKRDPLVDLGPRAVDVGYFNVKYTLGRQEADGLAPVRTCMFPAMAPRVAAADLHNDPDWKATNGCVVHVDGVSHFVGLDAQHWSSGRELRTVEEDYCITPRYRSLLSGALYYMMIDAGDADYCVIPDLVLGLPLNTKDRFQEDLRALVSGEHEVSTVQGATKRVLVERVHILAQPVGTLMNFARSGRGEGEWVLVVDVGGGTLDWYLATQQVAAKPRSGAYPKAMLACAYAVADAAGQAKWRESPEIIQRIDTALRRGDATFKASGRDWKLADFANAINAVVEESYKKMLEKLGNTDDIDRVILTGGGAPLFAKALRNHPNLGRNLEVEEDSVYSNVRGFQYWAERLHARSAAA